MTSEFDIKLVRLAANCPALWDKRTNAYRDKTKKQRFIRELAQSLDTTCNNVEVRFRSLRDRYRREKLKMLEQDGADETEHKTWPLFKDLSFLDAVMFRTIHEDCSGASDNGVYIEEIDMSTFEEANEEMSDFDDRLADLAAKCPALWDKRSNAYKNKIKKERRIKELAMVLNCSPHVVQTRFRSLRDKYRREKLKLINSDGALDFEPWHLLKPLSFLDAVQVSRRFFCPPEDYSRDSSVLSDNEVEIQEIQNDDTDIQSANFDDKLAHLAAKCPALWDRRCNDYRDKKKKQRYLKELAMTLNCSIKTIQTRFKALREKYRRERVKMEGGGTDHEPWHLLDILSFLDEVHVSRKPILVRKPLETNFLSISQDPHDDCSATSSVLSENEVFIEEIENPTMIFDLEEVQNGDIIEFLPSQNTATSSRIADNDVSIDDTKVEIANQIETAETGRRIGDQEDAHIVAFGQYLMATLRRLPTDLCDDTIFQLTDILRNAIKNSDK